MKTIIQIILIALLTYIGQLFMPWWVVFLTAAFTTAIIKTKGPASFLSGFVAIFILWLSQVYFIDIANESILSTKVAAIFGLSPILLMLVTALIGGICGGFGALTGKFLIDLFNKKKEVYSVYT